MEGREEETDPHLRDRYDEREGFLIGETQSFCRL